MSTWWEYVVRTAGTNVQKMMAEKTGISETAFSRWQKGRNQPDAPKVIAFARAYGRPPVEALIAAGYLSKKEAGDVIELERAADELSTDDLIEELRRRASRDEPSDKYPPL